MFKKRLAASAAQPAESGEGIAAREMRALAALALPIIATQVAQMAVTTTDVLMVGRLGAPQLAAIAIAATYQFTGWMLGLGPVSAVAPIIAQQLGADPTNTRDVRRAFRMVLWAVLIIAVPLAAFYAAAPSTLRLLGQSEEVIRIAVPYIWIVAPGMLFAMSFQALRNVLAALSFARAPLAIAALLVGLNALFAYSLIFGHFGLPRLELAGAALASTLSNAISFLALLLWIMLWPTFARYRFLEGWWRADLPKLKELFRLGLPIGITTFFEATLFQAGVFMMGHIGTQELAAHQIAINVASITFMVPLGLSQAATVRVGLAAGARNLAGIRIAAFTAIGLGAGFMLVCAAIISVFAREIAGLYLGTQTMESATVVQHAISFLYMAAAFQLFDSSQATAAGALRGLKDTRIPAYLAGISYWLVGFPVALGLGFFTPLQGNGIWLGYVAGLAAASALLGIRVILLAKAPPLPQLPDQLREAA